MKKIGKQLKPVLVLLLALVMLFTAGATAAFAVTESETAEQQTPAAETAVEDDAQEVNTGWFDIYFDKDNVKITLKPDIEELKGINQAEIQLIVSSLIDAFKSVVIEDIKGNFELSGDFSGSDADEKLVGQILDLFTDRYYASFPEADRRMQFFKELIGNDPVFDRQISDGSFVSGRPRNWFKNYASELISTSIKFGVIDASDLPEADKLGELVTSYVESTINEYKNEAIEAEKAVVIASAYTYVDYLLGADESTIENLPYLDLIRDELDLHIQDYVHDLLTVYLTYMEGGKDLDSVESDIHKDVCELFDYEVHQEVHRHIADYFANGTSGDAKIDDMIKNAADSYARDYARELVKTEAEAALESAGISGAMKSAVLDYIDARIANDGTAAEKKAAVYALVSVAGLKDYKNGISSVDGTVKEIYDAAIAEIENKIAEELTDARIDEQINAWAEEIIAGNPQADNALYNSNSAWFETEGNRELFELLWSSDSAEKEELVANARSSAREKVSEELWSTLFDFDDDTFADYRTELQNGFDTELDEAFSEIDVKLDELDANLADDAFVFEKAKELWENEEKNAALEAKIDEEVDKFLMDMENEQFVRDTIEPMFDTIPHIRTLLSHLTDDEKATVRETFRETVEEYEKKDPEEIIGADALNQKIDEYCMDHFGMTYSQIMDAIAEFEAEFVVVYKDALENTSVATVEDMFLMIDRLAIGEHDSTLYEIFSKTGGVIEFSFDNIIALLKTLPSLEQIGQMEADKMFISYDAAIDTEFGSSQFTVTLVADPSAYDYIQRVIKVITDHVSLNLDFVNGTIVVDAEIRMPAIFTSAVLKACMTDKIPEDLKNKVFTAIGKNPDEAYAFFTNLAYSDIIAILEKIDFEDVLDREEIAKYVDLIDQYIDKVELQTIASDAIVEKLAAATGISSAKIKQYVDVIDAYFDRNDLATLTNEEILDKLDKLAPIYNTLKDYIASVYAKLPDKIKTAEVFDFYEGNGVFLADAVANNINVGDYIEKLLKKVNIDLLNTIYSFVDIDTVSIDASVKVSFVDIYSIEYYIDGQSESVVKGFLPSGAQLADFVSVTDANGYEVLGWMQNGAYIEQMPDADTKVTALTATTIDPENLTWNYDGNSYTLEAGVVGNYDLSEIPGITYSYQWYHNDTLIPGAASASHTVSELTDEGSYYCIITVKTSAAEVSYKTATAEVTIGDSQDPITEIAINTSDIHFDPYSFTYAPNTEHAVTLADYLGAFAEYVDISIISGNTATNAGTYSALIKLSLKEQYKNGSYALTIDGESCPTGEGEFAKSWTIAKQKIEITIGDLAGDTVLVYNGESQTVYFDFDEGTLPPVVTFAESENVYTVVGKYYAKAAFTLSDTDNYYLSINGVDYDGEAVVDNHTREWSIIKQKIEITIGDLAGDTVLVYNGESQTVHFDFDEGTLPSVVTFAESENVYTVVGKYYAKAAFTLSDTANYYLSINGVDYDGEAVVDNHTREWSIIKQKIEITIGDLAGNTSLVYNGSNQSVHFDFDEGTLPSVVTFAESGNEYKNVGKYYAKAAFTLSDTANYYLSINGVSYDGEAVVDNHTREWSITKYKINYSSLGIINIEDLGTSNAPVLVVEYRGTAYTFVLNVPALGLPDGSDVLSATYTNNVGTLVGEYPMTATITIAEAHRANYVLVDEQGSDLAADASVTEDYVWEIIKKTYTAGHIQSSLKLDTISVPYTGNAVTPSLLNTTLPDGLILNSFISSPYTDAGTYAAYAVVTLSDRDNYRLLNEYGVEADVLVCPLYWTITPQEVKLEDLGIVLKDDQFIYNTYAQSVDLYSQPHFANFVLTGDISKVNAGEYTAYAELAYISANYKLTYEGNDFVVGDKYPLAWSISPKQISAKDFELALKNDSFIYTGSAITAELKALPDYISYILTDGYTATNVGKYGAVATLSAVSSNYSFVDADNKPVELGTAVTLNWSIEKATLDTSAAHFTTGSDGIYNAEAKVYKLEGLALPEGITYAIRYYNRTTGELLVDGAPKNVGKYTVKAEFTVNNSNYTYIDPVAYDFDISARVISINGDVITLTGSDVYDGKEKTFTVSGEDIAKYLNYTIEVTDSEGNVIAPVNAADYIVKAIFSVKSEHEGNVVFDADASRSFTVKKRAISLAELSIAMTGSNAYDGNEKTFTIMLDGLGDIGKYLVYTLAFITGEDEADALPIDVGVYNAVITSIALNEEGAVNFTLEEGIPAAGLTFEIVKQDITLEDAYIDFKDNDVYTGEEKELVVLLPGAKELPEYIEWTITDSEGNPASVINVNTYSELKIVFALKEGYEASYNLLTAELAANEITVTKADIAIDEELLPDTVVNYDGNNKVLMVSPLPEGVSVVYTGNVQSAIGVYTVTAVLTPTDAANYTIGGGADSVTLTATFTIKANPQVFEVTDSNGNVVIRIETENGIPENYSLKNADISFLYDECSFSDALGIKYKDKVAKIYLAYDLNFVDENGDKRVVNDNFKVTLLLPDTIRNNTNLIALYINDDGVAEYEVPFTINNGYITFETNHFSTYALAEAVDATVEEDDSFPWWIILIIVCAIILIIIVVIIVKKRSGGAPTEPTEPTETAPEDSGEAEPELTEQEVEQTPAEAELVSEEETVEEVVLEEPVAEELVVEEPAVEEPVAEEPVVEEPVAEEPAAEEPAAAEAPEVLIAIAPENGGDEDEGIGQRIINGEVVLVSYRSSYMSRLIQADSEIQDYYTAIKNTLLSYKGVKSRISWNFESFNKGRIQCAKLNLKGRALLVYIGLDPNEYNVNKYHFVDVSDKPKFEKVPMLMKVKSDRGLKYVLELIEEMMLKNEIPQGEMPNEDYHMPYETTEELVKRDLVKVILPPGVTLDENTNIEKLDVGELIDTANANKAENASMAENAPEAAEDESNVVIPVVLSDAPVEEETVELAAEDAPAKEETVELAAEDAPAKEETVELAAEDAPVEEETVELAAEDAPVEEETFELATEDAPVEEEAVEFAAEDAPAKETAEEAPIVIAAAPAMAEEAQEAEETTEAEEELHVDAIHADELLSDEEAEAKIELIQRTALMKSTKMAEVNLDTICENYEDGDTVELQGLQEKRIVNKSAGRLKVLARGVMTKRLTVIADKFSLQAVKMITLAGGTAEQLK